MGALADTAKKNSNFFKIEKGETMVVTYVDYRIIPSTMDPTKDSVQYRFATEFGDKFWTNGSGPIMLFFDSIEKGTVVSITRAPWINKDGSEDTSKSTYVVEEVKQEKGALKTKAGKPINPEDILYKD